jgi:class 3 adenylate cyclase
MLGALALKFMAVFLADRPFTQIVQLLARFPDSSLSHGTLKILNDNNWEFPVSSFQFESTVYDLIVDKSPDCTIIVDRLCSIILHNVAAQRLIQTEDAIGKNILDKMMIDLFAVEYDDESEEGDRLTFGSLLNDYMLQDRRSVLTTNLMGVASRQKFWYLVTILPIFGASNDVMNSRNSAADRFALIFRDIGDEKRQQNLVAEETRKHLQIVHQILPTEIATRLLRENRSISMTVDTAAVSFCDIVQFTPWCSAQTPETVVTTLNFMFNLFDDRCSQYRTVTKIKCIGDCYMSAAGIFSSGVSPKVFGLEIVQFCLDLIDAIDVVNEKLGTRLSVRIGVALGGPISAGVMVIRKPSFDIWGEAVNEASALESSGLPMKVHVNSSLRNFLRDEGITVEAKGDGTFFCVRS